MRMLWNYKRSKYEEVGAWLSEDEAVKYIPALRESQNLFTLHLMNGATTLEALLLVTEVTLVIGVKVDMLARVEADKI